MLREAILCVSQTDPTSSIIDLHSGEPLSSFRQCAALQNGVAAYSGAASAEKEPSSEPIFYALLREKPVIASFTLGRQLPFTRSPVPEPLTTLAVSGSLLAAGSASGRVFLWHTDAGTLIAITRPHFLEVTAIEFSADSQLLACGSKDAMLTVFDVSAMQQADKKPPLYSLAAHSLPVTAIAFSHATSAASRLFSCSLDHTVLIHDMATGGRLATLVFSAPLGCLLPYLSVGQPYTIFATSAIDGRIFRSINHNTEVFGVKNSDLDKNVNNTLEFPGNGSPVTALAISPSALFAGTKSGVVLVYDPVSLVLLKSMSLYQSPVVFLAYMLVPPQDARRTASDILTTPGTILSRFHDPTPLVVLKGSREDAKPLLSINPRELFEETMNELDKTNTNKNHNESLIAKIISLEKQGVKDREINQKLWAELVDLKIPE